MITKCLAGCNVLRDKCKEYMQDPTLVTNPNQGQLPPPKNDDPSTVRQNLNNVFLSLEYFFLSNRLSPPLLIDLE